MAYVTAAAFPVLPGQADRVRNFAKELEPHMEEFERLNKEAGDFRRFSVFLQESPMGDLAIFVFEVADPSKVRLAFTETPYDQWWLDYLRDVHGLDIRGMPEVPSPPPIVYDWQAS
ncbi:MAG TPA: hypothetical protein VKA30_04795 [Actinomycetota bacterium]|nr:hypothetical protein [Actinomycetota bacterium]